MPSKIMLVDDDETLLRFLGEFLRNHGFTVITASGGSDALRLAYKEHPDLAVLDVMMPGMDGWELCARMREMDDLPVLFLTAKSSETDKLRGFHLGVDDYVTKPFSFAELTARIQAVLNRVHAQTTEKESVISFAGLTLDLSSREVRRGNETISLTPTEFRLLEVLGRHKNRAVSESELVQAVWGDYKAEDTNAIRRYIFLLRQKIEPDPAHPRWILTVRGYGYRIGSESVKMPSENLPPAGE